MKWRGFGHGMALAYIRLDLGAAAGQRKAEATVQVWKPPQLDRRMVWLFYSP